MVTTSNNHSTSTSSSFKNYVALTKPKLTALLLLTAIVEAFVVYSGNLNSLFLLIISVLLSCMGTNVLAGYLDRDIDSVMKRTMNRPLPKGKIKPRSAFIFGFSLLVNGIFIAAFINSYVLLWGLMGAGFVLLYNCWLKRYTPYNILIASPAGAAPLLGAYSAMTGNLISLQPFLLALLIIFWTPVHIWSLAVFYREDYRKAGVPMLPVVERNDKVMWLIVLFTMLYIANAFAVFFMLKPLWVSLFMILLLNYPLVRLVVRSVRSSSTVVHYILFKLSGPHLGTVFTVYLALSIFMR